MRCPDHPRELSPDPTGVLGCPFCGGKWMSEAELEALSPGAMQTLTIETREDSGAFAKSRACPECNSPLSPWRIGKLAGWVERCGNCERYWVEKLDLRSFELLAKQRRMRAAYQSFTPEERKELVADLASATVPERGPELSPMQWALAFIGIPSVTSLTASQVTPRELAAGRFLKVPYATWTLAALLVGVFVAGLVSPLDLGPEALAYRSGSPWDLSLFTAAFAHFGWWHLIGNVGFLLAFGDGVEQRVSRWLMVTAFLLLSPVTLLIEALLTSAPGVLIGGASGGISLLVGACLVLQPGARVTFVFLARLPVTVPMIAFGIFEVLYQALCALIGVGEVAWWAHLSGLVMGLALGAVVRWRERSASPASR